MSQTGGPRKYQKMPARLAARQRRAAAEWVRRAGRGTTRRCPPVWQPDRWGQRRNESDGRAEELPEDARPSGSQTEEGSGGMSQTGGPRKYQKMPARLAARQRGQRRNESDGRAEELPKDARPSGSQTNEGSGGMSQTGGPRNYQKMPARLAARQRRAAAEWVRRAGRGNTRRCPPVWQPDRGGQRRNESDGRPRNYQKMPARLAARQWGQRRNESDGRAEELPEDARPSGSQTEEGSGGMSQTGGPRNYQKMPARLAARQRSAAAEWVRRAGRGNTRRCPPVWQPDRGGQRRNESDGRAEELPEDARPSGSQTEEGSGGMSQTGGRGTTRRCPPVWQPDRGGQRRNESDGRAEELPEDARPSGSQTDEGSGGMSQTGPRNYQKMPARLAARQMRAAAEWVRRAGRGTTRRCPPVWQPDRGGQRRNESDGRAEEIPEDARPSGSQTEEGSGGMSQTGGPRNYQKMPARLAARQRRAAADDDDDDDDVSIITIYHFTKDRWHRLKLISLKYLDRKCQQFKTDKTVSVLN